MAEVTRQVLFNANDTKIPTVIPTSELPTDFPFYTVTGESPYKGNFLITPHTNKDYTKNYIFIMNPKGEVLKYKKIENQAYDFKKVISSKGHVRYTYLDVISSEVPTIGGVSFYENTQFVVLDEDFAEVDRQVFGKAGEVPEGYSAENHFALYLDDANYIVATYFIPEGSAKYENAIQEKKYGKVVWHWETNDAAELASLSHTTPTGDYAHVNAMVQDYDGNYIISFRNIGIVKLNKTTKEIMWVIGTNRNDFTGLDASLLPFQQHDVRVLQNDGSITIFDNYGDPEQKSRILRYWLDEETMTCTRAEEYVTTKTRSNYMGSAQIIDASKNVYDIVYGSGWDFGFEEYDFSTSTQLMQLTFNEGHDLYNINRDVDLLATSFSNGNTPVEPPVVLPTPIYSISEEVFDGTRYIDTGLKLFDTPKDFSFAIKFSFDKDYIASAPINTYETILHDMYELQPWDGITINMVKSTTVAQSVDCNLTTATRFDTIAKTSVDGIRDEYIIVFTRNGTTGVMTCGTYNSDGSVDIVNDTTTNAYKDSGLYREQNLYIGAADMTGSFERHFVGTIHQCNIYDQELSPDEILALVNDITTNP